MTNDDDDDAAPLQLCVAPGLPMLHTRECSHLEAEAVAALQPASPEQLEELPVCSSCRAALDGGRRRRFDSFDDALEAYQAPLENRPLMREIAAGLAYSEIWIPSSSPYIAVSPGPGERILAYFNRGRVDIREDDGGYRHVVLPVNWLRGGGGSGYWRRSERDPEKCTSCHMQLPATGVCDDCDS